jgi:imidazolonepropionase-like amidohydrolase
MRKRTVIALAAVALTGPSALRSQATSYAIDNVNVVDVVSGTVLAGQRVVVTGSRITALGADPGPTVPPNAIRIDGAGKYLIPGMWDMHVHVTGVPSTGHMLGLFLANGITGVRDMGSSVDGLLSLRPQIDSGRVLLPRVIGSGVLVDGKPIVYPGITWAVTTPDEARKAVDSLARRGVNFIKAYEMLRPEVYSALAAQARLRGLPFAGHLPLMVSAEDAVRAGHRSFEHLRGLEIACSSKSDSLRGVAAAMIDQGKDSAGMRLRSAIHAALRPRAYETYDEARCSALILQMARAGAWQTPNIVLASQQAFHHDTTNFFQRWVQYLPAGQRDDYRRAPAPPPDTDRARAAAAQAMQRAEWFLTTTKRLHDAGVRVLPGSDFPNPVMIPGASLHEELVLLVRAGLTPAEALRSATQNPAIYLGMTDSLGTIAPGKSADLVLLDANPLADIRNVARVHSVWRAGRYLSRAAIDLMLEGFAKNGR